MDQSIREAAFVHIWVGGIVGFIFADRAWAQGRLIWDMEKSRFTFGETSRFGTIITRMGSVCFIGGGIVILLR